jgi:hypothetical protein
MINQISSVNHLQIMVQVELLGLSGKSTFALDFVLDLNPEVLVYEAPGLALGVHLLLKAHTSVPFVLRNKEPVDTLQ